VREFFLSLHWHLASCILPHTHQQNGVDERKHRHIVEMGLALLAQASMPLKYWDQAFLTATHLINRTPTKLLDFDTSLHHLLGATPNYSNLRVFGCACWPNLRPYNSHKLQFLSTRCAFLGYINLHKGFKCLEIATCHVYILRDIILDESIFPFAQLNPQASVRYPKADLASAVVPAAHLTGIESGGRESNSAPTHRPMSSLRYIVVPLVLTRQGLNPTSGSALDPPA
jgi:hypothetical protein